MVLFKIFVLSCESVRRMHDLPQASGNTSTDSIPVSSDKMWGPQQILNKNRPRNGTDHRCSDEVVVHRGVGIAYHLKFSRMGRLRGRCRCLKHIPPGSGINT